MNKKEKASICALIATWEFQQGGSASEAATRCSCAMEIKTIFNVTESDLASDRCWEIAKLVSNTSDEFMDRLSDAIDLDYEAVLDALDAGMLEAHLDMVAV